MVIRDFLISRCGILGVGFAGYEYRLYDFKYTEYSIVIERKDTDKSKFKLCLQRSKSKPILITNVTRNTFIEIKAA